MSPTNDHIQEFAQLLCLGGFHIFWMVTYFATAAVLFPSPSDTVPPSTTNLLQVGISLGSFLAAADPNSSLNTPWTTMVGCAMVCYWVVYALEWQSGYWFQFAEIMVRLRGDGEAYRLPK
ncbi:hypothetical protein F4820DRAFT_452480 [Hypoxylon rubiginosum]|uniref:Uncharacterized protein n=1 Tax=Hypoxylon rubiginosum TaxID=110542 RepID=A0ACB9YNS7_9PEZI|nr:hypothetical protein F4820DRAFT_452480 [Hypoxylon rubiginosum]